MSKTVFNAFEPMQVNQQRRDIGFIADGECQCALCRFSEPSSVGNSRQRIVLSQEQCLGLGDTMGDHLAIDQKPWKCTCEQNSQGNDEFHAEKGLFIERVIGSLIQIDLKDANDVSVFPDWNEGLSKVSGIGRRVSDAGLCKLSSGRQGFGY